MCQLIDELNALARPYDVCRQVLTTPACSPYAQFLATSVWRAALCREFSQLPAHELAAMMEFCFAAACACKHSAVRAQIWALTAALCKRQWSEGMCNELLDARLPTASALDQLQMIGALLTEFNCRTAAAMSLAWEDHVALHRNFERLALARLFHLVVRTLQRIVATTASADDVEALVCSCLQRLVAVLEWEFDERSSSDTLNLAVLERTEYIRECGCVRPGAAWTTLLVSSDLLPFLFALPHQHAVFSLPESAAAGLLHRLLTQLASLDGTVFPNPDAGLAHALALATGTGALVAAMCSQLAPTTLDSLAEQCGTLGRLVQQTAVATKVLTRTASDAVLSFVDSALQFTMFLLRTALAEHEHLASIEYALECVLDSWIVLSSARFHAHDSQLRERVMRHCETVSTSFIEGFVLRHTRSGARFVERIAAVARASDAVCMQLLTAIASRLTLQWTSAAACVFASHPALAASAVAQRYLSRAADLQIIDTAATPMATSDWSALHDSVAALARLCGYLVADDDDDSDEVIVPKISRALVAASARHFGLQTRIGANGALDSIARSDPLVSMMAAQFQLVAHEVALLRAICDLQVSPALDAATQRALAECVDIRSTEALSWMLARGSGFLCGLSPAEYDQLPPSLGLALGAGQSLCAEWCELAILRASVCLFDARCSYASCARMLLALSQAAPVTRSLLARSPAWQHLVAQCGASIVNANVAHPPASCNARVVHACAVVACEAGADDGAFQQLLQAFGGLPSLLEQALEKQSASSMVLLRRTLRSIRGLCCATGSRTLALKFVPLMGLLESLARWFAAMQQRFAAGQARQLDAVILLRVRAVVRQVLLVYVDLARVEVAYLTSSQTLVFFRLCVALVNSYSAYCVAFLSDATPLAAPCAGGGPDLDDDVDDDTHDDDVSRNDADDEAVNLGIALDLCSHVASKSAVDFSVDAGGAVSAFVLEAVCAIVFTLAPRVSFMSERPEVLRKFYALVEDAFVTRPDTFLHLSMERQDTVAQILQFGVAHSAPVVVTASLKTLHALASFGALHRRDAAPLCTVLVRFQQVILQHLLLQRFAESVIDSLSDALLSLIAVDSSHASSLVDSLLQQQQGNAALHARLQSAFRALFSSGIVDLASFTDRKNRFRFRKLVRAFLVSTRGVLTQH